MYASLDDEDGALSLLAITHDQGVFEAGRTAKEKKLLSRLEFVMIDRLEEAGMLG